MFTKRIVTTLAVSLTTIGFTLASPVIASRDVAAAATDSSQQSMEIWPDCGTSDVVILEPNHFDNWGVRNYTIQAAHWNDGMVLDHAELYSHDRNATTCPAIFEHFFQSGDERFAVNLAGGNGSRKSGYYYSNAKVGLIAELINLNPNPQSAFVTVEYEFLPKNFADWEQMTSLMLDASGLCNDFRIPPPRGVDAFPLEMSPGFVMPFPAVVGGVGGHVDDGAVDLQVLKNGEVACSIVPGYGQTPGSIGGSGKIHISNMSACIGLRLTAPGDEWAVMAHYDFKQHEPIRRGPIPAPVKGILVAYLVRLPPTS
ncbi:Uu.00g127770.m01.CDS01 [Anthostomella pinea]|uniref:Uu.00g127770.m01.CDS01 n=1 Tax=Anthostomella pinea TaxID=933095 RepID=A0AAI8YFH9_9PEZI|nr:Uu.00g127770.m01.CDS01 [Anthostomella pinea]